MRLRNIVMLLVGMIAGSAGFYGYNLYGMSLAQSTDNPNFVPEEPLLDQARIGALGRLEPQGEVVEIGGRLGERIGALLVREGQYVEAGAELVRLDNYNERLAERDFAEAQLLEAQKRLAAEVAFAEAQIIEAETRIQQIEQPKQLEIAAQQANVRRLEAELTDAQADLIRFQTLFDDGAIAQLTFDDQVLNVEQKREDLNNSQAILDQLKQARDVDLRNAEAQVNAAEANLQLVQAQIQIESLQRNLDLAAARLEQSVIRAPQVGQVLKILRYPGESTDAGQGILEIANTQQMMVVAEIYETDVTKISVGQSAQITSRAFEGELTGSVDSIGLQIGKKDVLDTDPAASVDARVVEVKIRLDPQSSEKVAGLTNMQVTVAIDVSRQS